VGVAKSVAYNREFIEHSQNIIEQLELFFALLDVGGLAVFVAPGEHGTANDVECSVVAGYDSISA
jgi:hypothetical protein